MSNHSLPYKSMTFLPNYVAMNPKEHQEVTFDISAADRLVFVQY